MSNLYTVQVSRSLFGFKHYAPEARLFQIKRIRSSRVQVVEMAKPVTARAFPSLVNLADSKIFVSGGYQPGAEQIYTSVDCFEIDSNTWSSAPDLNVPRAVHSSCAFSASVIYSFCGFNGTVCLNSIEKLVFNRGVAASGWQLIEVPSSCLLGRRDPLVSQINENEIVILGGYNDKQLGDGLIFDCKTNQL